MNEELIEDIKIELNPIAPTQSVNKEVINIKDLTSKDFLREVGIKKMLPDAIHSMEEVYNYGQKFTVDTHRILYYLLYMTGLRVTEALNLTTRDIDFINSEGKQLIVINAYTEKKRRNTPIHVKRAIPLPLTGTNEWENLMAAEVAEYINYVSEGQRLFHITRVTAWRWINEVSVITTLYDVNTKETFRDADLKLYPHFLRHCRATHMARYHNYGIVQLMQFFGWTTPTMANIYISLGWKDLSDVFFK